MLFLSTKATLWTLIVSPTVWALHFVIVYPAAAVACAKGWMALDTVRVAIAVLTVLALAAIAVSGASAWRHSGGVVVADDPLDDDTHESRQRFLANATLLLAGLSFVAVLYVALSALVFETCR